MTALAEGKNHRPLPQEEMPGGAVSEPIQVAMIPGHTRVGHERVSIESYFPADPTQLTDSVPLVVHGGWGTPMIFYADFAEAVVQLSGKPVHIYQDKRTLGRLQDINPANLFKVGQLSQAAGGAVLDFASKEFGQDIVDKYGHSRGGKTAVDVAKERPKQVRNVVLDLSCGLTEASFRELLESAGEVGLEVLLKLGQLARHDGPRKAKDTAHHTLRNLPRTLAEGVDAGHAHLSPSIAWLQKHNIGVTALTAERDKFFPHRHVARSNGDLFGEHLHKRSDPNARHIDPQLNPLATARLVLHALNQLQQPKLQIVT